MIKTMNSGASWQGLSLTPSLTSCVFLNKLLKYPVPLIISSMKRELQLPRGLLYEVRI